MTATETTKRGTWSKRISIIAIFLAALSLLALGAAPLGWRTGLLPLKAAFELLMLAAIAAVLGGVTAAIALPALAVASAWHGSFARWLPITVVLTIQPFYATTWRCLRSWPWALHLLAGVRACCRSRPPSSCWRWRRSRPWWEA